MPYNRNSLQKEWLSSKTGLPGPAIDWAKDFGEFLAKPVEKTNDRGRKFVAKEKFSTNQLRKFFAEIKRLQFELLSDGFTESFKNEVLLIKPKLAYAKGRDLKQYNREMKSQSKIDEFHLEMTNAVDSVNSQESFINFVKLVEATVAYHKASGGE